MITGDSSPIERLAPLMERYSRLDEFYQGRLNGYITQSLLAFESGLQIMEALQGEKQTKPQGRAAPCLRVVRSAPAGGTRP